MPPSIAAGAANAAHGTRRDGLPGSGAYAPGAMVRLTVRSSEASTPAVTSAVRV